MSDTAPIQARISPFAWVRSNLFPNWWNSLLTIGCIYLVYSATVPIVDWAIVNAVWMGQKVDTCRAATGGTGACWAFIEAKWGQIFYGQFPIDERWRVHVAYGLALAGLVPLAMPSIRHKGLNALYLFGIYPILAFVLLSGGVFGLAPVETSLWGGLLVTLVVAATGMVISMPLGILLALGRRSQMPVVRMCSIGFIEFWRGIPLVTILFIASVLLPLFLEQGVSVDKLLRAMLGVALFASAYMAEVVRGGLQAIGSGQYEAARALGFGYWRSHYLVVLPQAITHVIPGIVNTFIGLFKDTTLVLVIGLFDLLGIVQSSFSDPNWSTPQTAMTGYVFTGFVFWIFCYAMSLYSQFMERRLARGAKKVGQIQ
jgi:general L-amino acid transport system permease protein